MITGSCTCDHRPCTHTLGGEALALQRECSYVYSGHAGNANTEHNIGVQKQYVLIHVYMAHTWYTQNTQNLFTCRNTSTYAYTYTDTDGDRDTCKICTQTHTQMCIHSHICTYTDALTHVFIRDTNAQVHIQLDILKYTCTCAGTSEGFPEPSLHEVLS